MARTKRGLAIREALRAAGRKVFARDGYVNARLGDIAGGSGSSTGMLDQHYEGEAELLADLAGNFSEELRAAVHPAAQQAGGVPPDLRAPIRTFWLH